MNLSDLEIDGFVDQLTTDLLDARIVLLRGLPGAGKTRIVDRTAQRFSEICGTSPAVVAPTAVIDVDKVLDEVHLQLAAGGSAAILLDDWGAILRSAGGAELQARLVAMCVDGRDAAAIGVLITAGVNDNLSRLNLPGSPLADAAHAVIHPPVLDERQILDRLARAGVTAERAQAELTEWGSYALLRPLNDNVIPLDAERTIRDIAASVGPDHARRLLDLLRRENLRLAEDPIDRVLAPAVYRTLDGRATLPAFLHRLRLADLLIGDSATWPDARQASLRRLAVRLHRVDEAIWFDRYLPAALPQLTSFLDELAPQVAPMFLRLLGSTGCLTRVRDADVQEFRRRFPGWRNLGFNVEAHLVDQSDYIALHDRQIASQQRVEGYHLPPADRIVGRVPAGNETDAYIARAATPLLANAWARSRCWVCEHRSP